MKRIFDYIRGLPLLYSIGGGAVIVVVAILGVHFATRPPATVETPPQISHVQLESIANLSSQTGPLVVTGKVTSINEATILAQSSGEVTRLSHVLGDHIAAGGAIAQMEDSSQRAAVVQAQGSYDAAQAALAKASGSTATNSGVSAAQAAQNAANAQTSAVSALQSTYVALDDAVHTKADTMFNNPRKSSPTLIGFTVPDSQLVNNIQTERSTLEAVLADANSLASASGDIDVRIDAMSADVQTVQSFLTDLIQAVNEAVPNTQVTASQIAAFQATLGAARTEVVSTRASLTTAKSAYDSAQTGSQSASNSATAGTQNDIAAAQANVKQALGALQSAQANEAKTIIRSPISGTIVSLAITEGDYISAFSQVADVSNPGALEVDTSVTASDAKTLAVGGKALIDNAVSGTIVSIAPALDPTTNKIAVKVAITGSQSSLTDGSTVSVALSRSVSTAHATTSSGPILIPIIAAKITPQGPVVLTVSSSTIVTHAVTLGTIFGDQVTILSGVTSDMEIVTDVRGLVEGQQVVVDAP